MFDEIADWLENAADNYPWRYVTCWVVGVQLWVIVEVALHTLIVERGIF